MTPTNWETLFWKYVNHVSVEESVTYLSSQTHMDYNEKEHVSYEKQWCTDEEWAAIQQGIKEGKDYSD